MRTSSVDQIVIETLERENAHLTSLQVYEKIRAHLPAVNPSTVYRALERLAHLGRVSVADVGTGASVYEAVSGLRHHHLVCQDCGEVVTIGDEEVGKFFAALVDKNHFQIVTNHLILFGLCPACQPSHAAPEEQ